MTAPKTRYAKSGDVSIAYQIVGEGPFDLVLVPGWVSHVERIWDEPAFAAFLRRLASFSRLILIDRRGTGLSDRVSRPPTLEERMDDVRAVMDAAGSPRAALFGVSEGGQMCMLFAASHPERTSALALYGTFATNVNRDGYTHGYERPAVEAFLDYTVEHWGTGVSARAFAPSVSRDPVFVESWARIERNAVSPGGARALLELAMDCDVRHVLPSIRVPTLVVHRSGDLITPVAGGRYIAERVPGAKFVELPGQDHFPWIGDAESILGEVQEFFTGARGAPEPDRVLATLLFVDIAGSTERVTELGDSRWRELLERFYAVVRGTLTRFGGAEVDSAGDGLFASFDGPARAVRCACAIRDAVAALGVRVRAGLHTGECTLIAGKLGGLAVHLGARVAAHAQAGEVLVSSTVKDLVAGSGLEFGDRGAHSLKGVPGEWRLFVVQRG